MIPSRLDKYLSDATALSRSQIRRAWSSGDISVQAPGAPLERSPALGSLVFEEDVVRLGGELVTPVEPSVYAALNKPADTLSSAAQAQGEQRTLRPWLEPLGRGVFPVGRLDRETQGLMVLTDDGDLSHVLTHPDTPIIYTYDLHLDAAHEREAARICEALVTGVALAPEYTARVVSCGRVASEEDEVLLRTRSQESRSRQLRSMCNVLGIKLRALKRTGVGPVTLGSLAAGELREFSAQEVKALWQLCGGRERVERRRQSALARLARRARDEGAPHLRLERWLTDHGVSFDELAAAPD